jgi:hypothetical protein
VCRCALCGGFCGAKAGRRDLGPRTRVGDPGIRGGRIVKKGDWDFVIAWLLVVVGVPAFVALNILVWGNPF